jgi:predicted DNA-binding ribbon-helix-helix protein
MAAREGMTTPAFVSRLHDEVLALHGQALNFASLLRCACLIDVSRGEGASYALAAE